MELSIERNGGMQARVSVLLIAPFAFKEIKLFLVCATAGETPEEAFPSLRFFGSCQVWSSAQFWEPLRVGGGNRRGRHHLGATRQAGVWLLPKVLAALASQTMWPWPVESSNLMCPMFVTLTLKK